MNNLSYRLVDVFAEHPYSGNQLAVFTHAAHLSHERMQQIARELLLLFRMIFEPVSRRGSLYDIRRGISQCGQRRMPAERIFTG